VQLRDRVVFVTGASGGIGRALCSLLGREGAILGLLDRDAAGLERQKQELEAYKVRCATAVVDVRSRQQVHEAVAALKAQLGPADILVAAAGICGISLVDDLRVEQLEEIIQINFLGSVYAIEAVLPAMLQRGSGQIVGMASMTAIIGIPFESAYGASKAALRSYLESLRPALRRRGVLVTTVFPGFVQTPLLANVLTKTGAATPPGVMPAEVAVLKIAAAIRRGSRIAIFPLGLGLLVRGARLLPAFLFDWIMTRVARRIPLPY
jgi:short-subunit dehydrogenase